MTFLMTLCSLFLSTQTLFAATASPKEEAVPQEMPSPMPPPSFKGSCASVYMSMPTKERAADLKSAFDLLRKEKTSGKVYFQLSDGTTITNIIDMNLLPNSSLISFRYNTSNQGIRLQIVKVEDIVGLSYY